MTRNAMNPTRAIIGLPRGRWCIAVALVWSVAAACTPDYDLSGKRTADAGIDDAGNGISGDASSPLPDSGPTSSNGTAGTGNGTTAVSNSTTGSSNGTTGTGGTTTTSNGTTGATSNSTTDGCMPSAELCDGLDNDCDGVVDEEDAGAELLALCDQRSGASVAGCSAGRCVYTCADGRVDANGDLNLDVGDGCECTSTNTAEVCDGIDNDCNGQIDDEDRVLAGCATLPGTEAIACTNGACVYGCVEGFADLNSDLNALNSDGCECMRGPERCDGVDNNCNGQIDEPNTVLLTACVSPPGTTATVSCREGACAYTCEEGRVDVDGDLHGPDSNGCECTVEDEVCDGVDNNCNGVVDEVSDTLLSRCDRVFGTLPQSCSDGVCLYACVAERFDIDMDLELGPSGSGCECFSGDPGCDTCDFVAQCTEGTPDDYNTSAPASRFNAIALSLDSTEGVDLDGDGAINNVFGPLLNGLFELTGSDFDLNQVIAEGLEEEQISVGLVWPTLDGAVLEASEVTVDLPMLSRTGNRTYVVTRDSFLPGSQTPRQRFTGALVAGGRLRATGGRFQIPVPEDIFPLSLSLSGVEMEGDLSDDSQGIALSNGYIAGGLPVQEFFDAFNGFLLSDDCSCVGLAGPLFDLSQGSNRNACTQAPDTSACTGQLEEACATLVDVCELLVTTLGNQADLDLDGDGLNDAYSTYLIVGAQGVTVTGVQPP